MAGSPSSSSPWRSASPTACATSRDAFDLTSETGVTVEVKSSAYLQSRAQRGPSVPSFGIAPTVAWSEATNEYSGATRRQAQVYVFALLCDQDRDRVDPLDVAHWEFFVVPTAVLDQRLPGQKTIGLPGLLRLRPRRCRFEELAKAVEDAGRLSEEDSGPAASRP